MPVTQNNASARILILSSAETPYAREINDKFIASINQLSKGEYQVVIRHYNDIGLHIRPGKIEAFTMPENESLATFDFIYFKSYYRYLEIAVTVAEYLQVAGVPFHCSELNQYISLSKLSQYTRLGKEGMPIPETLFLSSSHYSNNYHLVTKLLGSPFIFKTIDGRGGDNNFLISTNEQLNEVLRNNTGVSFVAQTFIPNSSDLRILVINNQIKMVIRRQRQDDSTHLNNTSQGAQAFDVPMNELPQEVQALALHAAQLMKREIAGVDLMFEKGSDKPYILEVNASPQVASGAFEEEKLKIYSNYFKYMLK